MPLGLTSKYSTFRPQIKFMCFFMYLITNSAIALYNIKLLFFVTETDSIYSAVRIGLLNKTDYISSFEG